MTTLYTFKEFNEQIVPKYFPRLNYENVKKKATHFFEKRNQRFVDLSFYVPGSALNITKLDFNHYFKIDKKDYRFKKKQELSHFEIYFFEYLKPYFRKSTEKYAEGELITDLYLYHKKKNEIIGYLEAREIVSNFLALDIGAFIGFIRTEKEYQYQGIGTFMLRIMALYLNLFRRREFYSDTLMAEQFLSLCRTLHRSGRWVERKDYENEESEKIQERYLFHPPKIRVKVKQNGKIYDF